MATFGFKVAMLDVAEKMMFGSLDFSRFLICYSGDLSGTKSDIASRTGGGGFMQCGKLLR